MAPYVSLTRLLFFFLACSPLSALGQDATSSEIAPPDSEELQSLISILAMMQEMIPPTTFSTQSVPQSSPTATAVLDTRESFELPGGIMTAPDASLSHSPLSEDVPVLSRFNRLDRRKGAFRSKSKPKPKSKPPPPPPPPPAKPPATKPPTTKPPTITPPTTKPTSPPTPKPTTPPTTTPPTATPPTTTPPTITPPATDPPVTTPAPPASNPSTEPSGGGPSIHIGFNPTFDPTFEPGSGGGSNYPDPTDDPDDPTSTEDPTETVQSTNSTTSATADATPIASTASSILFDNSPVASTVGQVARELRDGAVPTSSSSSGQFGGSSCGKLGRGGPVGVRSFLACTRSGR